MNEAKRSEVAARYAAPLRKVKRWLALSAATVPVALVLWQVVVPLLPSEIQDQGAFLSITVLGLAVYAAFASSILWVVLARERKVQMRDLS